MNVRYWIALVASVVATLVLYWYGMDFIRLYLGSRIQPDKRVARMYSLPDLPYAYDALEPYIDKETMLLHHTKHHQSYIDAANQLVAKYPQLRAMPVEQALSNYQSMNFQDQQPFLNAAGGHYNHSLFWESLTPHSTGKPQGLLAQDIEKEFGSFETFVQLFSKKAKTVFGSGWVWLCVDAFGQLHVHTTVNQDCPLLEGLQPILGLDVWEHAYYLQYQNRRSEYIDSWWNIVDWEKAAQRYKHVLEDV